MKNKYIKIALLALIATTSSQVVAQVKVGDNPTTVSQNAVLEVESTNKGLLLPRLALTATNSFFPLTAHVEGMTVYNTATAGAGTTAVVPGYYYNDGTKWVRIATGADAKTEPWFIQNTADEATVNTDNIYQQGKVAVGFDSTDAVSGKQFEVKGDVKSVAINAGTYNILETNNTDFGGPMNIMGSFDNTDLLAANNYSFVSLYSNSTASEASLMAKGADGTTYVSADDVPSAYGLKAEMRTSNSANTVTNAVVVGSNGAADVNETVVFYSQNTAANTETKLHVDKTNGITFKYGTIANPSGNYTFPKNNGTAGQVLVTDGAASTLMTGAQLSWADASSLITVPTEPWNIQSTTNPATANTENIYQMGNVAIGTNAIPTFTAGGSTISPKFHVAGDISTTGKVWTTNSVYADYVFEKYFDGKSEINEEYEFKSLDDIKAFVAENKHLPGVTKIDDLMKDGNGYMFDMTALSIQQLEKIEELFLHVIEQNEQIIELNKQVEDNNKRLEALENLLLKNNSK